MRRSSRHSEKNQPLLRNPRVELQSDAGTARIPLTFGEDLVTIDGVRPVRSLPEPHVSSSSDTRVDAQFVLYISSAPKHYGK
jgi:hypothetical protein